MHAIPINKCIAKHANICFHLLVMSCQVFDLQMHDLVRIKSDLSDQHFMNGNLCLIFTSVQEQTEVDCVLPAYARVPVCIQRYLSSREYSSVEGPRFVDYAR